MPISNSALLRKLFWKDRGLKVLSLLLAAISWYAVRTVIGVTTTIQNIPVVVKARDGMAVVSQSRATVTADFSGSQEEIAQIQEAHARAQIQAVVFARSRTPGARETLLVHPRSIEGLKGARTVKIHRPSDVAVVLDAEDARNVLVKRPECRGKPEIGLVTGVERLPATVRVLGPKGRLAELRQVETEAIDVGGATESFERTVNVVSPGNQWITGMEPSQVRVLVTIERVPSLWKLPDIPVEVISEPSSAFAVELRPARVGVVLNGGAQSVERLAKDGIKALVDCTRLEVPGQYDLPVVVHLPPGVDVTAAAEPSSVKAMLRKMR